VTEQPSSAEAPTNEILIHARREYRKEHGVWPSRSWKPLGRHLAASAAAVAKGPCPKASAPQHAAPPKPEPRPQRQQRPDYSISTLDGHLGRRGADTHSGPSRPVTRARADTADHQPRQSLSAPA
jgi:hypothetical protein